MNRRFTLNAPTHHHPTNHMFLHWNPSRLFVFCKYYCRFVNLIMKSSFGFWFWSELRVVVVVSVAVVVLKISLPQCAHNVSQLFPISMHWKHWHASLVNKDLPHILLFVLIYYLLSSSEPTTWRHRGTSVWVIRLIWTQRSFSTGPRLHRCHRAVSR